jgi:glycosyltransferase involved in cell wall biosynthesis
MKIYFIGQKGLPATGGGVENHVENLATRLAQLGHKVYVYTRHNYSDKNRKKYRGVNLINLPSISSKNFDAVSHTFLAVIHVLFQPADVIHFHSIGPSSFLWLVKIVKRRTVVLATFHSQCYLHAKWGAFARFFLKFGEYILCRFADAIIVPSQVLQHYIAKRYQRQPIYIPNGVTMPGRNKEIRELKELDLISGEYILTIGRLVRNKNVHLLIAAYQKLKTDKKLVIVGEGAYTDDYVQELINQSADNKNIIFLGNKTGAALRALFANAAVFVQASESEGLSIALLEAMSYSLPVLVSDIEENAEAIGEAGFTFCRGDAGDLKMRLQKILQNISCAQNLGKEARARVAKHYDWDNLIKETVAVYEQTTNLRQKTECRFQTRKIAKHYYIAN